MNHYSVAVALFDFVPVLLTAIGMLLLATAIAQRQPHFSPWIWLAACAIPFGGVCKASWKLIVALQQLHMDWLENLLFITMAPGFVAMAFFLHHTRRAWQSGRPTPRQWPLYLLPWLALPLAAAWVAAQTLPQGRVWFFILLGTTTVANALLIGNAWLASRRAGLGWLVMASFVYNFAATLALSGLSRLAQSEATAWIQEGVNFSAQAALAFGFWHLARAMKMEKSLV